MPWPFENGSSLRVKKVRRSRKWLILPIPCTWWVFLFRGLRRRRRCSGRQTPALDLVEQATAPGVEAPCDREADHVEQREAPQGRPGAAGERDRRAIGLWDEKRPIGADRGREPDDCGGFHLCLLLLGARAQRRLEPWHFRSRDRGDHLEGRCVADSGRQE